MVLETNKLNTYVIIGLMGFTLFLLVLNKTTDYGEEKFEYFTQSKKKSVK